jgi:lysophospholipase L1-like esterase
MAFWKFTGTSTYNFNQISLVAHPGYVYDFGGNTPPSYPAVREGAQPLPSFPWTSDPGPATDGQINQAADLSGNYQPARLLGNPTRPGLHFRKMLASVRSGDSDCKVLCVGDSTTFGQNANDRTQPYPAQVASLLNSGFIPAARGLTVPPSFKLNGAGSVDPFGRWTAGTGWTVAAIGFGQNAAFTAAAAASGTLVFADSGVNADGFDIYYAKTPTLSAALKITATGGATATVNCQGTQGIYKTTVMAGSAATTNTVTFDNSTGAAGVYILGVEPVLSTAKRVRVGNAGVSSSTSTDWATDTGAWRSLSAIKAYAPDLSIISLGINDAAASFSASAYQANLQALIAACQVSGDVLLLSPVPSQSANGVGPNGLQISYGGVLAGLGYPFASMDSRFGIPGSDVLTNAGMQNTVYHPNDLGYADIGQWVAGLLMSL